MIKAVLFDFDGTLIDTNDLIFKSYRTAFKSVLNRDISDAEILTLYGRPLRGSLMEYGEPGENLYNAYREFNETRHDELAKGFEGASEGVRIIMDMGFKTGIVTAKRLHMVKRGLSIMGLEDAFDVIITPDDTEKSKPNPEPVLLGCEKLNVKPFETLYVGDSIFDMQAGKSAGTQLCAVKYTLTPIDKITAFNPEFLVDSITELADILRRNVK